MKTETLNDKYKRYVDFCEARGADYSDFETFVKRQTERS